MRKFLLLIRQYWNFILFLLLEVTCFVFIAKSRNMQGMDLISSSNSVVGYIYKKQDAILYYFKLKKLNDSLLQENARLNNALARQTFSDTFQNKKKSIPTLEPKDSTNPALTPSSKVAIQSTYPIRIVRYAIYEYIPARVIKNSISNDKINFITLNRGFDAGIKKGMAVVSGNGIVGRVAHVSKHFSTVASVLSYRKISARLNNGTFNFIVWNPGNPDIVEMDNIPITTQVKIGDSVFTTGYSYFPGNILIGKITKIINRKNSNSKTLIINLSTNFRNLQYVYVVKDKMGYEKRKLESQTEKIITSP